MRRSFRGTAKKRLKEDMLNYLINHKDDWVFIGELHKSMTDRGYNSKAVGEVLSLSGRLLYIVYSIVDDAIYIAKIPDELREELLDRESFILHRAKKEFKNYMMGKLYNKFQDIYVENISIV